MLGDIPERSFLGKFGLGSMPNLNFVRWWLKPSRSSLVGAKVVIFFYTTLAFIAFSL